MVTRASGRQRQAALALQGDNGTEAASHPGSTSTRPGGKSIYRHRVKGVRASESRDRALDLAVLLTHFLTLGKFQHSGLLACG